jgi:hypothetical protein
MSPRTTAKGALILVIALASQVVGPVTASPAPSGQVERVAANELSELAMLTPKVGYGLFTTWGGTYCQDIVGSTSNGGASFSRFVLVERWSCDGQYPQESLMANSRGVLFVYGHGFSASYDGGKSWEEEPHVGIVRQLVTEAGSLWQVDAACHSGESLCPLRVMISSDGGRTWGQTPTPPKGAYGYATTPPGKERPGSCAAGTLHTYFRTTPRMAKTRQPARCG